MEENKKLPLILVIALPILLIISTEVAGISFDIAGNPIYIVTLIYPLTFLASALITKKGESKNAITLVILSLIIECLVFVLKWVFLGTLDYLLMEVTFLAFFMSHFLLLMGYEVLEETKKTDNFGCVLVVLLIATLIETMFYSILFSNVTVVSLIVIFVIKLVYDLIIAKILSK